MATIRQVAQAAGASVSAASAVLNGGGKNSIRVGAETRARIEAAARTLGYKPNQIARSLVSGRTGVLGLVFPYSSGFIGYDPFCGQVMAGVVEVAIAHKYNLMLHTSVGDDWNAADADALLDARVDGLLLVLPVPNSPVVERCREQEFPCVSLVYAPHRDDVLAVNADDFEGGKMATEHLLGLGHTRIAHLTGNGLVSTTEQRLRGYTEAFAQAGLDLPGDLIASANFNEKQGYAAMQGLLELSARRRPTAVFAGNDLCADGAMRAMRERGMRVPDDIAVVGYDDTWFAAMTRPQLTTVRMPIAEMSRAAAEMLIARVQGRKPDNPQPILPVSLTVRESCGAGAVAAH